MVGRLCNIFHTSLVPKVHSFLEYKGHYKLTPVGAKYETAFFCTKLRTSSSSRIENRMHSFACTLAVSKYSKSKNT